MNLDLSLLGWAHTIASLCALLAGALVLIGRKADARHRMIGKLYLATIAVTNLTAFGIYRRGIFWFPHWFGVAALVAITIGFLCVRYRLPRAFWLNGHMTCMVASYYMLIGGGVNEIFLRINALHALAPDALNSSLVGMTHLAVMVISASLIAYFNIRYATFAARLRRS